MPGVGHAYIGHTPEENRFYIEQTEIEEKTYQRHKDGQVDMEPDKNTITTGDLLYGTNSKPGTASTSMKPAEAEGATGEVGAETKPKEEKYEGPMVKRTGNTMTKHKSFVKKLAASFKAKEKATVDADATTGVKFVAHTEYAAKIRRAILAGEEVPKSCTGFLKKPPPPVDHGPALQAKQEAEYQAKAAENLANPPGFDKDSVDAEMAALVEKALQDKAAKKAAKANGKPAWAMTETAAATAEEAEEAELLEFVDNLDYDKYIGEMDEQDLKTAIKALDDAIAESEKAAESGEDAAGSKMDAWKSHFAGAVNRVREVEDKALEAAAAAKAAKAAAKIAAATSATEASEAGSEAAAFSVGAGDAAAAVAKEKAAAAEAKQLMESYPELAKVHSKQSLQQIIERAAPLPWASAVTGSEIAHRGS